MENHILCKITLIFWIFMIYLSTFPFNGRISEFYERILGFNERITGFNERI
jgi:hypothetical protein